MAGSRLIQKDVSRDGSYWEDLSKIDGAHGTELGQRPGASALRVGETTGTERQWLQAASPVAETSPFSGSKYSAQEPDPKKREADRLLCGGQETVWTAPSKTSHPGKQ